MPIIDLDLKRRCAEASLTMTAREIYNNIFVPEHNTMCFETFRHKLAMWKHRQWADGMTLSAGTYEGFTPHNATVQVNSQGQVIQSWIKQSYDDGAFEEFIDTIKANTTPIPYEITEQAPTPRMLEIGLYDMHFGLPNDYSNVYAELREIILSKNYEEINIILGQDLLHNDDFRGRTSKGTPIEKVDLAGAWEEAKRFWSETIKNCFAVSQKVKIWYVKGNHDESMTWGFVQMLKAMFPTLIVDDSLAMRKALYWRGCFCGLTHGNSTKSSVNDLRGQFTIKFSDLFAMAKVREIHCGHLHHEREADVYGVMCRRLCTANAEDGWSDDEGHVGAHKRFMVFEWAPDKLKDIHYLYNYSEVMQ